MSVYYLILRSANVEVKVMNGVEHTIASFAAMSELSKLPISALLRVLVDLELPRTGEALLSAELTIDELGFPYSRAYFYRSCCQICETRL